MKIPSLSNKIKVAGCALLAAGGALGGLAGCLPVARQASFPARADTVEPGSLFGPFEGQVLDAATGKPVPGALVYASWGFDSGRGLDAPAGARVVLGETDEDGRYTVAALTAHPGGRARLERFVLIIYKRGYVAYRSDRMFETMDQRRDFSQRLNRVRLERFAPGQSHARHVRFIGGSGALRRALEPEVIQASLELTGAPVEGPAAPAAGDKLLDASGLISVDELRAATGFSGEVVVERLADLPQSASYDSRHFRAVGRPESYDAAVRVWRVEGAGAAQERFAALAKTMPQAAPLAGLGEQAVTGRDGPIRAIAARSGHAVLQLTCGVDQCRDDAQLQALARRLLGRAERLEPTAPKREALSDEDKAKKPEPEKTEKAEKAEPDRPDAEPEKPLPEERPFQLRPPELHR
jgi:hypothetical protein